MGATLCMGLKHVTSYFRKNKPNPVLELFPRWPSDMSLAIADQLYLYFVVSCKADHIFGLGAKSQILSSVAPPGNENSIATLC